EALGDGLVGVLALALDIGGVGAADVGAFVPFETEPAEAVHQVFDGAFDEAFLVGVLDADDKSAFFAVTGDLAVGEEDVVHDEAGAADVEGASGAGGKADANLVEVVGDAFGASGDGGGIWHSGMVLCGSGAYRWRGSGRVAVAPTLWLSIPACAGVGRWRR